MYFSPLACLLFQLTQLDAERLAHGVSNVLLALQPRLKEILDLLRLDPPPSSPAGLDLYQATSGMRNCNYAALLYYDPTDSRVAHFS